MSKSVSHYQRRMVEHTAGHARVTSWRDERDLTVMYRLKCIDCDGSGERRDRLHGDFDQVCRLWVEHRAVAHGEFSDTAPATPERWVDHQLRERRKRQRQEMDELLGRVFGTGGS